MELNELTYKINGAIFEVNRVLGPGFLEKVYENALALEFESLGLKFDRQVPIEVIYKNQVVGEYVADMIVENSVILEFKTVEALTRIHDAQLLNYLKATNIPVGILVNFKEEKATIRRMTLNRDDQ
jgi:GxxExxY protein